MMQEVRADARRPSVGAVKDKRQLTKARVIDQDEVIRLREERKARDMYAKRGQGPAITTTTLNSSLFFNGAGYTTQAQPKKVKISKIVTVNLISPGHPSLQDD